MTEALTGSAPAEASQPYLRLVKEDDVGSEGQLSEREIADRIVADYVYARNAPDYGETSQERHRFANRHNVLAIQDFFRYDPDGPGDQMPQYRPLPPPMLKKEPIIIGPRPRLRHESFYSRAGRGIRLATGWAGDRLMSAAKNGLYDVWNSDVLFGIRERLRRTRLGRQAARMAILHDMAPHE